MGLRVEGPTMAYDDLKEHDGETYSGMRVGGEHRWTYPDGRWVETKQAPDRWTFTFASEKRRDEPAPPGSGVPEDTRYHWYILAHQRVRKVDKDTYATLMEGVKRKIGHRRPHWHGYSYEYEDQASQLERVVAALRERLEALEARLAEGQSRLDRFGPG